MGAARINSRQEADAWLQACYSVLRPWLDEIPLDHYDKQSVLDGWTIRDVIAHLGPGLDVLSGVRRAPAGAKPLAIGTYIATYPDGADQIAEAARALAAGEGAAVLAALDAAYARVSAGLTDFSSFDGVVAPRRGAIRLPDLIVTRTLELVVHGDDIARSLDIAPPAFTPGVMRSTVRTLLDALAEVHPGKAVEVRVPPYAVVQCLAGPRHTRGTPSNTIETDPWTWIRLATGRVRWQDAVDAHQVSASGARATLSGLLPLL